MTWKIFVIAQSSSRTHTHTVSLAIPTPLDLWEKNRGIAEENKFWNLFLFIANNIAYKLTIDNMNHFQTGFNVNGAALIEFSFE